MTRAAQLLSDVLSELSPDQVTVAVEAGATLEPGTVLGKITASGKYVPFDQHASDGREHAAGILYDGLTNGAGAPADLVGVVVDLEVRSEALIWPEDLDAGEKAAAIAELGRAGIMVGKA